MVNYKTDQSSVIVIGGQARTIKSNETSKLLTAGLTGTTGVTLHDPDGNTNYVVPTGKTFKMIGMKLRWGGSTRTIQIIQNDDIDAKASEVGKFYVQERSYPVVLDEIATPYEPTFTEGKYINHYTSNASAAPILIYIIGVEY